MTEQTRKPGYSSLHQIRVLDRAVDILDCFVQSRRDLTIPEIVEVTGLNRSTTRRLIANLLRHGLVQQTSDGTRYRLGVRLLEMGSVVLASFSLREAALGPLSFLEREVTGTILLAARIGDYSVIVDRRESLELRSSMVLMPSQVGAVRPLTHGPIGQVILSSVDTAEVRKLLEKYPLESSTPYSITHQNEFLRRTAQARETGHAGDVNEIVEGIMALVVPIKNHSGQCVGALALGFSATREADEAFLAAALNSLKAAGAGISANMGYRCETERTGVMD